MKRSMAAALTLGFGLLGLIETSGPARAMPEAPSALAAQGQGSQATKVWEHGYRHWREHRRGYWRPGYGWVPFAVAGAAIAGAVAADRYYDGPNRYYGEPYDAPPPPPRRYYGPDREADGDGPPPRRYYGPDHEADRDGPPPRRYYGPDREADRDGPPPRRDYGPDRDEPPLK